MIAAVAIVNVNVSSKSSDLSDISLANVEALADGEDGDFAYKIDDKDCTILETIDADLCITVGGRRWRIANGIVGGTYTKTWTNAARDCSSGGSSSCVSKTCGDFYATLSSI